jgi:hypothetical protein
VTSRFDNLSADEMLARHRELVDEKIALEAAIKDRLVAECPVKIGKTYLIGKPDGRVWPWAVRYKARRIFVRHILADWSNYYPDKPWKVFASGPLERPSISPTRNGHCGGRYTSTHQQVLASRLELETERDPPEGGLDLGDPPE